MSPGRIRHLTLPACAGLAIAAVLVAPVRATTAGTRATVTCNVKKDGRRLGTTYVTSLRATALSCTRAKRVVRAFHACRRARGALDGRCTSRVLGFGCSERRGPAIETQYSARVSCRNGARAVRFAYTQFT